MSIFIVIDSEKKNYVCKLIDLVSFEPLASFQDGPTLKRDQGLIKGTKSLIDILENIRDED